MTEFHARDPCPYIPDDLTVAQFILDSHHTGKPQRPYGTPWFIEDATGRQIGYEEVRMRTFGLANALHKRWGIQDGDIVGIFSPNHVEYPTVIWAAHRLGATVATSNPTYTADELAFQLKITGCNVLVVHPDSIETALAASRQCNIPADRVILIDRRQSNSSASFVTVQDLVNEGLTQPTSFIERKLSPGEGKTKVAFLCTSSGTTGRPKAVAIPHVAVIANVIQMAAHNKANEAYTSWEKRRYRAGDVHAAVLPLFHIYGLVVSLHLMLFCGYTLVIIPKFDFSKFLKSIDKYKINHLFLVPPQIVLLCKHPETRKYDLSHIKYLMSGAAPLSAELTQQLIKILPNASIGQGYGMTETSTVITMFPTSQTVGTLGSAGQLIPGTVARVIKTDGTLANYDEEGELHVKAPSVALKYLNNEEATKETFVNGWVRTGDEVKFARSGDMFVVDRLKEILKVRGFQVAPAELEGHLLDHPDVADVCVVGIVDDYSGEVPLAFVVLEEKAARQAKSSSEATEKLKQSIAKHVSDNKVAYKWLKGGVEFVDVIPKNPSGKLLRRVMREKAKEVISKRGNVKAKL